MIDPDGIMVQQHNPKTTLTFHDVPDFDYIIYDLEDDKDFKKYLSSIEKEVRGSFEYRQMIKYLKDYMGMDQCAFIQVSSKDETAVRIEIHHYPFTLFDIVSIVYRKRCYYQEPLDVELIAKEVTMLHYKLLVGLIPLSVTAHQLTHAGKLFIPVQDVLGRYRIFVDFYKDFCDPEQLDALDRIEKYSIEQVSDLLNSQSILQQNTITIENIDNSYQLPDMNSVNTTMNTRIEDIKSNGYRLPSPAENRKKEGGPLKPTRESSVVSPFFFSRNE